MCPGRPVKPCCYTVCRDQPCASGCHLVQLGGVETTGVHRDISPCSSTLNLGEGVLEAVILTPVRFNEHAGVLSAQLPHKAVWARHIHGV
eukprot:1939172-Amphidinium_carterae.3